MGQVRSWSLEAVNKVRRGQSGQRRLGSSGEIRELKGGKGGSVVR
jgi:hypothetical protein